MMQIRSPYDMQNTIDNLKFVGKSIGFIPTMGALHQGHLSMIKRSKSENNITVVSVFVNPTQFNSRSDLDKYPRQLQGDLEKLKELGVDYAFTPKYSEMYPDNFNFKVSENELSKILCGASRPGHFTGVLTVVLKLFQITQPDRSYFGEKDYQQLQLIKNMVEAFFIPTEIVACPTIRDEDDLALSSRNKRLSEEGRKKAQVFAQALRRGLSKDDVSEMLQDSGIQIDYVEDRMDRRYGAVYIEDVRLIDNVPI